MHHQKYRSQLRKLSILGTNLLVLIGSAGVASGFQNEIPTEVQEPGTQPNQVPTLEDPNSCTACHGEYDRAVEPMFTWRGSMMAQASRDPLYWATVAVADQTVPGVGDLCLRCHVQRGWYDGHSIPTDGSRLLDNEADGVSCDVCHKMTNPDDSEWLGNQLSPFLANDEKNPPKGYFGGGMLSLYGGPEYLGPYGDLNAPHESGKSLFHRSPEFCGSCHDVSNPVVGDLAPNSGAQPWADPVVRSGVPGAPVEEKAAFNNFPYMYGVVERTFSENMSSAFPTLRVADYTTLPEELKAGIIKDTYHKAMAAGPNGDYADGAPRFFTCQTCHMAPENGKGAHLGPERSDLPVHDLTGGSYWMPDLLQHLDAKGQIILGGGFTQEMNEGLDAGKLRAIYNLENSAVLTVNDNTLRVVNLTGHKLISGYPEGRRMWLNLKWFDRKGKLLREDGKYDYLKVRIRDEDIFVRTLLDLHDPNTRVYAAHSGVTQEWAALLRTVGFPAKIPLAYNRITGAVEATLGQLSRQQPGTTWPTMHFALNNLVIEDNRIPPYGFSYDEARKRNSLPVPPTQYGDPGPGGTYNYFDSFTLNPPPRAVHAEIKLLYQSTSWEYIQFLFLANDRSSDFLGDTGENLLDGWLETGMCEPVVMATATWGEPAIDSSGAVGGSSDPDSVEGIGK